MTSLVAGQDSRARWAAVVEQSVAGSVHQAELPFSAPAKGLSGAGMDVPGLGAIALRGQGSVAPETPDEQRINRSDKGGRLVKTLPMAPPRLFNAGSVFERHGTLMRTAPTSDVRMAFERPSIKGREVQIASAFHMKEQRHGVDLPPVIAALATSDTIDILATAYAATGPDYARASPFASILREESGGRFIPPVDADDHSWGRLPLPPHVFSDREQQCLAAGIYFEARGESVKGQAAVAQVVLNRVRNPAYPNTICGVVYQNKNWRNRCQFSFACDGIRERVSSPSHFQTAREVAMATTAGRIWLDEVGTSTHYHATYVNPRWASAMKRMQRIGRHVFYRTYGGGWN